MFLEAIPFFFKSHAEPGNGGYPDSLPFRVYFDAQLGMYRQEASPDLQQMLERVYREGSFADGSVSNESGTVYREPLIACIERSVGGVRGRTILEIGCGTGAILESLQAAGARVTGLEPGDHPKLPGIPIIDDFFPSPKLAGQFDVVTAFLVLEHVPDPVQFLVDIAPHLANGGRLIVGVPNCEPFLATGDISIFIHEHYSYFTPHSLAALARMAGYATLDTSIVEGMVVVTLCLDSERRAALTAAIPQADTAFERLALQLVDRLQVLLARHAQGDIAIYVPGRALNTLFVLGATDCRLVDDSVEIRGRYLPGLKRRIESFQSLLDNPPRCILIWSRTFGERIRTKCRAAAELSGVEILTLNDIDKT